MSSMTGLVVAGAGARGAYEAGALAELVPRMHADGRPPTILVGTSAGALNVVGLAGFCGGGHSLPDAAGKLVDLWSSVHLDQVADVPASVLDDGVRFTTQFLGLPTHMLSLLDTRRQRDTLSQLMPLKYLRHAIDSGPIDVVAVVTTSAATGGTVIFVDKKPGIRLPAYDARRNISYVETQLTIEHVLASAAVPVAFRPVFVAEPSSHAGWYLDGGVRLNVPLKPALEFGCDHLGVVATQPRFWPAPVPAAADLQPDLFHAASVTLQALMADRMVEDLGTLAKVNRALDETATTAAHRLIEFLFAGPPNNEAGAIGALAEETFARHFSGFGGARSPGIWLLERLIGGAHRDHGDLLSFLFFESEFTSQAAALGARHAREILTATGPWVVA